ncbi:hypothetical protein AC1031_000564 [Aphanomyces cochlioides]|nr:hypothetical protein AC1031_000564 [Aphanomyces cochlioides]
MGEFESSISTHAIIFDFDLPTKNTLFAKIAACRDTLDGYSGACAMTSAFKKLRSSLKRAKMESKDVVVDHMLPLVVWIVSLHSSLGLGLLSSLDATVVQVTCRVVASFANTLGAAFIPFAGVLLVPLLDAACVRRKSADNDAAISMASPYCVEALAKTTRLSVPTLHGYYKAACATRSRPTEGGWKRHVVAKLLGMIVETWPKDELKPHYTLLKGVCA